MSNYVKHLEQLSTRETYKRKKDYIKFNIKEFLPNKPKNQVRALEVGPGLGEFVSFLNDQGITNIDIMDNDKSVLNYVSKRNKIRKVYFSEKVNNIGNRIGSYDLIVLIQVLEHLPISILKQTIKVLFTHLNRNGNLVIVVPNANNPLGLIERYADLQHTVSFTEQSLYDLVNLSGIKNYKIFIKGYEIPINGVVNLIRIVLQKILHLVMLGIMIINGGVFFKTMTPNIMMIIKRN